MTSEKTSSQSRTWLWTLGAIGLIAAALVANAELGQRTSHAKKHASVASEGSDPGSISGTPSAPGSDKSGANDTPAAAAARAAAAVPHNIDTASYINQRYSNQVTPQIVMLPPFTEEDKERKAREMFPEYARMQAQAEAAAAADRAKRGATE